MKRVVLLVMLAGVAGCGFAQKHPGVTVGLVVGTIGFSACQISVEDLGTCSIIGGTAGLALGGITGLITMFTDTSAHQLHLEEEEPDYVRVRSRTSAPPGLPDGSDGSAGVPDASVPPHDAGAGATADDAGAP
jgi:hypothetical protein